MPLEQVLGRGSALTVSDAVDVALRNNPSTRAAWADARAANAEYRSAKGAWFPAVSLSGSAARSESGRSSDGPENPVTSYSAAAGLSCLILDFGGRAAAVDESRQAFFAEEWTRNAVIQKTVLQAEVAFFSYAGAEAMLEANRTSLAEAEANLEAAEERKRVGLATGADVLQAKTAYSEVKLAVLESEGVVRTARASLAASMGYPPELIGDLDVVTPEIPDAGLSATVEELIDRALAGNPELQASRAASRGAGARVTQAWSRMLPSFSAHGNVGRTWPRDDPDYSESYSASLQVEIPIFTGLSQQFDLLKARAQAEAQRERTRGVEQETALRVFSAHSEFLTAVERVKTTDELVAGAQQSEEVAAGRYREGVGSILDLLSAQRVLGLARAEQVNARLSWFVALTQLAHDVGVLGLDGSNPLVPGSFVPR
ncbi:MAG: TolC family protein [Candidatus Eisenbacteria bacterium]|nr:TolC family protein [Candidatus Eisenbacteria bacterium]